MKQQRWYEVTEENGIKTLNVYNEPDKKKATVSSHVDIEEMKFYRNNFKLRKVWTQEEIERNYRLQEFN
ncbi:hypothetical protein D3C87_2144910 [compost metagenome]